MSRCYYKYNMDSANQIIKNPSGILETSTDGKKTNISNDKI